MLQWTRDFKGYGGNPPDPRWPEKSRLALSFVLNFEEGAELNLADGDERNEGMYEVNDEVKGALDPCMMSHYEYGTRAGYWRIMEVLDAFGVKVTVSANGRSARRSPELVRDAVARGHEISCHGYRWETHSAMTEEQERNSIAHCVQAIQEVSGSAPVGWHTRSASSARTRRLLVEQGGFLYDSDAYNDDLPYVLTVGGKRHVVLPYCFDTNDMRFQPGGGFIFAGDFTRYCAEAVDRLWEEGGNAPKMLSIGLHQRIIGRPARINGLVRLLEHVTAKGGIWIARRRDIAAHWRKLEGLD